ncbi:class F sortase [Kribbella sp. NPDC055071]
MGYGRHRRRRPTFLLRRLTMIAGVLVLVTGAAIALGHDSRPAGSTSVAALPSSDRALPEETTQHPHISPKPATPRLILIPQLSLRVPVVDIAIRNGELSPPSDPQKVGWWSGGALPGAARGSAVVTGHAVHNGVGAFDDLEKLRVGALIVVTTSRGELRYQVTDSAIYRKQELATQATRLFDQAVAGRLVLVTCSEWDGTSYLSNAVVTARRISNS